MLNHSIECATWPAMMADELGATAKSARRAALLHDIGKAVDHEMEGGHPLVGGELARRYSETEDVAHAMVAHHDDVEPQTVDTVIVQAADAIRARAPAPAASRWRSTSSGWRTWRRSPRGPEASSRPTRSRRAARSA